MSDLLAELQAAVLDARDVEHVLLSECSGSLRHVDGWVEYRTGGDASEVYARAKFKHGVISQLQPGPVLQRPGASQRLREKASESAATTHGSLVANRVMFAARPLLGEFRWRDALRLLPCPEEAPTGSGFDVFEHLIHMPSGLSASGPPFPMLLEVRVQRSPIPAVESARVFRELDRAQHALTALVAGHLGPAHWPAERQWVSLRVNGRIENHLVHNGFSTGVDGHREDFVTFGGPAARLYAGEDYYDRLWGQDEALTLPASLAMDLGRAKALSASDAAAFRRACYWFALGIQHRNEHSLSIVCFATSIECLLSDDASERCPECNKSAVGPTQLFKRHLRQYGTVIPALESMRDKLYEVRSRLVHGSFASRIDVDFFSVGEDHVQSMLIEIVAQRGIVNWLRDRASSAAHTT
jgi:hypothetical protein